MTQPLNFRAERGSTSWDRADPRHALIEETDAPGGYTVTLSGGNAHRVAYEKRDGAYRGRCDCKGWEYRDDPHSPCAHLCTLRKAEVLDLHDAKGEPIQPADDDRDDQHPAADTGRAVATDGGHVQAPPAGADGRTFGRPEGQL